MEKMEERLVVVVTEWWDYEVFFSSLNSSVFFQNFLQWIDSFVTRKNLIEEEAISRALSQFRKGCGVGEGKAGHGKIFREIRMMFPPKYQELQGRCE